MMALLVTERTEGTTRRDVGHRLRTLRRRQRRTQAEVAERLSVVADTYRHWEAGRHEPSLGDIPALASALGLSPSELCRELFEQSAPPQPDRPAGRSADDVARDLAAGWNDLPEAERQFILDLVEARKRFRERTGEGERTEGGKGRA